MGFIVETVQTERAEANLFGRLRILESTGLAHAKTFDHRARPEIADCREGNDFFQSKQMETNAKNLFRGL